MSVDESGTIRRLPARDRLFLPVFVVTYVAGGLGFVSFETAVLTFLLFVGLYLVFS
ncbi:hypothetical protein [Halovivax asiaticus]|uniref:hypothetical protein n=1 Tax=Halovivax asiaticus TaxID=332953 RepID=UPI0013762D17|nr:hypothetical protein [Halovivax asiaticus]